MKRIIVLSLIVISVLLIAIVPAFAAEKRFDGVTLKVFANSHDPMLKAVKWSIPVVKEKFGIDILMDEAPYGTQFDKAMSAFVAIPVNMMSLLVLISGREPGQMVVM